MYYRPAEGHPLPHNPLKAIVSPRPIGWISTRGRLGDNLAPYSFFNMVADTPPQVMFASMGAKPDRAVSKDSFSQARESGVFCANLVSRSLLKEMNISTGALPAGEDEFVAAGLEKAECQEIDCPRVAAAPASLECRVLHVLSLAGENNHMIIGEVVGVHIHPDMLVDGRYDVTKVQAMSRLGYRDYAAVTEVFELLRPGQT
ncbi:flavin reductase family protein [Pseudooceanicola sp. CBS1P-1]|uniref:Flavin reductase family protein n=1 Tax=Pseudooceanicola albus TaxID=2692189 RepID=A0A6L7FYP2_9RHOB|nr:MULTISPECIES: flavin reductase family protein [Pseudooceanicola]MBT9382675.1 flavin reductase family protein [Pseudooceanicola endophyticus]MXN17214.1 flavin reductase family protein [Pseudooceanicola albus]